MSLPRAYQFVALRRLSVSGRQCRQLHMTGPATFPSAVLNKLERSASTLPHDVAGLRAECKKRKIDFSGSKHDLVGRLNADDITKSRAFTTAVDASKRPTADTEQNAKVPARHFNTSRVLKQVGDTSTMDFAFLPDMGGEADVGGSGQNLILDVNFSSTESKYTDHPDPEVMKAEISSMSADSTFSPMAEVHDNSAMPIDFHAVAASVTSAAEEVTPTPVKETTGTIRQLWTGLIEDVMGPKKSMA